MTLALSQPALADSPLSRWDPRWKLAALVPAAIAAALVQSLPAAAALLLLALTLVLVGRLPLRWYLVRIGLLVLFLLLFVVWLPFLSAGPIAGLTSAALVLIKAVTIVTLMLLLFATAPLEATLRGAHSLRVPGLLLQVLFLTYRYLFLLADEFDRLRVALRVRGFRNRGTLHSYRTVGHVSGILLVRSYERAERVAAAMRCRGFDGHFRCLSDFRTRPSDVAAFFLVILPIIAVSLWDLLQPQ